jgi:hypothetical protein
LLSQSAHEVYLMDEILKFIFEKNKVVYVFLTFFSVLGVCYLSSFVFGVNSYDIVSHITFSCFVTLASALITANKLNNAKVKQASK